MKVSYNIAFVNKDRELQWFGPAGKTLVALDAPVEEAQNIMILPSGEGLPFQIELPFGDSNKIRKVIFQFVADQYAEVDETWIFSWNLNPLERHSEENADQTAHKWLISGVAFPPQFKPEKLAPEIDWRLAVPDVFLLPASEASAFHLISPVAEFVAVFNGKDQIQRIISDFSLPLMPVLAANKIEEILEFNFSQSAFVIEEKITNFLESNPEIDISGWHLKNRSRSLKISSLALIILVVGLVFIGHFFLWFETYLTENAAQRTGGYISKAFNEVFPGVPVVDAVSQIRRKISTAENSLEEAGSLPIIAWTNLLKIVAESSELQIRLDRIKADSKAFALYGFAQSYSALTAFRQVVSGDSQVADLRMPETRKRGSEVFFVLEATWVD
ncbi:MAG: hypothetical protein ACQETH_17215 [Candidatus Rifleibacteriota bacterium]